ncbi:MAG: 50S ribosomal protein L22 [bacterium]|nr:50S ribosomal protein L22 [bacterium]
MEVIAKTRNLRMSARKVRLVADLVRGLSVHAALDQLKVMARLARVPVEKTLRSALANAEHNFHADVDSLRIAQITVDKGMFLKRWRPRAFGRAAPIHKHSCHITVILSDIQKDEKSAKDTAKKSTATKKKAKTVKLKTETHNS